VQWPINNNVLDCGICISINKKEMEIKRERDFARLSERLERH